MLSEKVINLLDEEEFKRLSYKLDEVLDSGYYASARKSDILQVVALIIEAAYKKGRLDERYFNSGPSIDLYFKEQ